MNMHHKKLYGTTTVGTKGQVVIPAEAREELSIKAGDKFYVVGSSKACMLVFLQEEKLEHFIDHMQIELESLKEFNKPKGKN